MTSCGSRWVGYAQQMHHNHGASSLLSGLDGLVALRRED